MASLSLSTPVRKATDPTTGPPSLTAPLPTIASLTAALPSIQNPNSSPAPKVAWCRDVFALVDRMQASHSAASAAGATDTPPPGPVEIADPQLQRLAQVAAPLIMQLSSPEPVPNPLPPHVAEAIFMRASFAATGAYPQVVPHNPRTAFRDYERSARAGIHAAWFRLGRDYENFGDFSHAKECFERGVKANNESCLYRMGMAHLMGQLNQPANAETALPLLHRAATLATVEVPQPAYVFGLLLLSEFSHVNVSPHLFAPFLPPGGTREGEARRHLERAAYLNFAPAQYKLGHAYEFAQPPFPFDALLSVQYYSLASQQGEIEADMALSKWFLCGADGAFEKDEALAFTFAEKAAKKSLPSAEFAMGYYMEVGVGGPKDIEAARKWYTRAAGHGNTDAQERLAALSQPAPQSLSRQEHDSLTETTLVRKRTQAKQRSDARGPATQPPSGGGQQQVMAHVRKASLAYRPGPGQNSYPPAGAAGQNNYPPAGPIPAQVPASTSILPPGPVGSAIPPGQQYPQPRKSSEIAGQPLGPPGPPAQSRPSPSQGPGNAGPPRAFVDRPRYGLTDPGSGSNSPRTQSPLRPPQTQGSASGPAPPHAQVPATRPPPSKGPQTFQEMGFQSAKLEEKECVVM
ncbi:HCP-like protein [Dentipellis sp. KUC8613]|nr:HCP-like protein [Dentipellis sp. KUC8613]